MSYNKYATVEKQTINFISSFSSPQYVSIVERQFENVYHGMNELNTSISAAGVDISGGLIENLNSGGNLKYFIDMPTTYEDLTNKEQLQEIMSRINPDWVNTWERVYQNIPIKTKETMKEIATHVRTVVDEISWLTKNQYTQIKQMAWCEFDKDSNQTRAARFAWIKFRDKNNNVDNCKDISIKNLITAYSTLGKLVHVTAININTNSEFKANIKIIEVALIELLEKLISNPL